MAGRRACPRELGVVLLPFLLVAFVAFKTVYWTCYVRKRKRVVLGLQNNEAVLAMSTRKCVCHTAGVADDSHEHALCRHTT